MDLVNKYLSADTQESIASGAKSSLYSFLEGSTEFCDAECISKTSEYFMNLFTATHDAETCPTIESYCGGCQNNAESFISANADSVPCCTQTALDSIIGVSLYFYIYIFDTFRVCQILLSKELDKKRVPCSPLFVI